MTEPDQIEFHEHVGAPAAAARTARSAARPGAHRDRGRLRRPVRRSVPSPRWAPRRRRRRPDRRSPAGLGARRGPAVPRERRPGMPFAGAMPNVGPLGGAGLDLRGGLRASAGSATSRSPRSTARTCRSRPTTAGRARSRSAARPPSPRAARPSRVGDLKVGDQIVFGETKATDGSYTITAIEVVLPVVGRPGHARSGPTRSPSTRRAAASATIHVERRARPTTSTATAPPSCRTSRSARSWSPRARSEATARSTRPPSTPGSARHRGLDGDSARCSGAVRGTTTRTIAGPRQAPLPAPPPAPADLRPPADARGAVAFGPAPRLRFSGRSHARGGVLDAIDQAREPTHVRRVRCSTTTDRTTPRSRVRFDDRSPSHDPAGRADRATSPHRPRTGRPIPDAAARLARRRSAGHRSWRPRCCPRSWPPAGRRPS